MIHIAKKPKNLNRESQRAYWEQQRKYAQAQLDAIPTLNQSDLLDLMRSYEQALKENEFAKGTRKIYIRVVEKFIDEYSNEDEELSKEDVITWKSDLLSDYDSVQTINTYITSLNRFLFFCDLGDFKVAKVKGQSDNVLSNRIYENEYKRLVRRAKGKGMFDVYFAIRIMGETGVRVDELKAFTGNSVKEVYVTVDNKGKIRKVPIPQQLRYELRDYTKQQSITNGPIVNLSYHQLRNGLKEVAGQCKIKLKKVHPHAFRHYFGFKFVDRKGELKLAQLSDIMGHSSVETTRVYTRGTLEDYLKTMEEIK